MTDTLKKLALAALLAATAPLSGCATVLGTAASPITGGVDLCVESLRPDQWYWVPFVFLAGSVGGPFVAFYNGVQYDAKTFTVPMRTYWGEFDSAFRPWDQIL